MAKRRKKTRKPKGLPRGVFTRLSQLSQQTLARRRTKAYTEMGEVLINAGALDWGTAEPLTPTEHGHEAARFQAARMSLDAWSKGVGESLRSKRFTKHKGRWYRRKPDGKRGKIIKATSVDRSIRQSSYVARVKVIQKMTGSTYAEARASYREERGEWDEALRNPEPGEAGHVQSPGFGPEEDEAIPLPTESEIQLAGLKEAEERIFRKVQARIKARAAERKRKGEGVAPPRVRKGKQPKRRKKRKRR
ncbi:MAG: hypothetical protein ACYTAN_10370 [Planctomycetota bacterium]|jgi:hypothetical protein